MVRHATFARKRWYPLDPEECRTCIADHLDRARSLVPASIEPTPTAGIVPHAGWFYSGTTLAAVYLALSQTNTPETLFLLGSTHVPGITVPTLWNDGDWETPLGSVPMDTQWIDDLLASGWGFATDHTAHVEEHSIELQVPFIRHLFPQARIVPILVPPTPQAHELGSFLASLFDSRTTPPLVVATTDMTHYGPGYAFTPKGQGRAAHDWVRQSNDPRMLELITELRTEEILDECHHSRNACSPGPLMAVTRYAQARGCARGTVLHYTTSAEVSGDSDPDSFVGYAGVLFG